MLARSYLSLAAAGCILAGCALDAAPYGAEGDEPESIGVEREALTTSCAASIQRFKLNGKLTTDTGAGTLEDQTGGTNADTPYYKRCTLSFWMSVGDRHFAKTVGSNDWPYSNPASIRVERSSDGTWVEAKSSRTQGTSPEVVDWTVDTAGTYRVCVVANDSSEGGTDWIRLTSDRSNAASCGAAGTAVDYCFGASSANCDSCSTNSDGRQDCPVSVGSNMHDTCCAHNPLGDHCNGGACNPGTGGTNCGWISNCSKEYNHAQNDALASRRWTKKFDPTVPYYRPLSAGDKSGDYAYFYDSNKDLSKPCGASGAPCTLEYPLEQNYNTVTMTRSLKAPSGQGIWDIDATNGWCESGSYGSKKWSWQGYYRICN